MVPFSAAFAEYEQTGFGASAVLDETPKKQNGWAIGGRESLPDDVRDRAYHAQPVWKRMAVIAAGPVMNFLLALVLLFVAFWGFRQIVVLPEVGQIRAHRQMVHTLQVELVAGEREVVVAEEAGERLEIVAIRRDRVDRDVPLVRQIVEKVTDFTLHARAPVQMVPLNASRVVAAAHRRQR